MPPDTAPSLVSIVADSASRFANRPALGHTRGTADPGMTYEQLWDRIRRGTGTLQQAGLKPGDRMLLLAESCPDWAAAFFSILNAGQVAVPILADAPPAMIDAVAAHAGIAAVIHTERTLPATKRLQNLRRVSFDQLFEGEHSTGIQDRELALLAFTSGSTRHPRAVELTHANLLADLKALLQVRHASPGHAFLSVLPPAHLFELMGGLLGPLAGGARIVYPGSPLPNRLVESLKRDGITHACCVPGLLQCVYQEVLDELVTCGLVDAERRHQSVAQTAHRLETSLDRAARDKVVSGVRSRIGNSFETLVLGGAALDPAWVPILTSLGIRTEIGYGLTEASPIVSMGLASECPPGSVGRPLPGVDVRIDMSGEILVHGPSVSSGYHQDPDLTRDSFTDGWLHTGDCGRVDEHGFLFVTGRLKEAMVTETGDTIYPEEIEPYYASPMFAEWCVAGLPGPHGNDRPALFVVPANPELPPETLDAAFQKLRAAAPARLRVESMVCLDQPLPRTALGKPRRRAVVAYCEEHQLEPHHA